jgi:hypothetical protein
MDFHASLCMVELGTIHNASRNFVVDAADNAPEQHSCFSTLYRSFTNQRLVGAFVVWLLY